MSDLNWMKLAITSAKESKGSLASDPLVGAVLVRDNKLIGTASRGEKKRGEHAEFTLLHRVLRSTSLTEGATLYTTLEPCTHRNHDKKPCAQWVIDKKVRRVVIGILDPNPAICGQGYWQLRDAGILVDFFPSKLADDIAHDNSKFIGAHRGGPEIGARFAYFLQGLKSPAITPYDGLGVGTSLSLQDCPDLRHGWPLSRIELELAKAPQRMPSEWAKRYPVFVKEHFDRFRFKEDGEKYSVVLNPTSFSDAPSVTVQLARSKYSRSIFCREEIAKVPSTGTL